MNMFNNNSYCYQPWNRRIVNQRVVWTHRYYAITMDVLLWALQLRLPVTYYILIYVSASVLSRLTRVARLLEFTEKLQTRYQKCVCMRNYCGHGAPSHCFQWFSTRMVRWKMWPILVRGLRKTNYASWFCWSLDESNYLSTAVLQTNI